MANFFSTGNELRSNPAPNQIPPHIRSQAPSNYHHINIHNPLRVFHTNVYDYPGSYGFMANPYHVDSGIYSAMFHRAPRPNLRESNSVQQPYSRLPVFENIYPTEFQYRAEASSIPDIYGFPYSETIFSTTVEGPPHVINYPTPRNIMEHGSSGDFMRYQSDNMRFCTAESIVAHQMQDMSGGSVYDFSTRKRNNSDKFNNSNLWEEINDCERGAIDLRKCGCEKRNRESSLLKKCSRPRYTNYKQISSVATLPPASTTATGGETLTRACQYDSDEEENNKEMQELKHDTSQNFNISQKSSNTNTDNFDFRLPPVGYEMLSDPVTRKILLIPAASIDTLHRTLFWPQYQPRVLLSVSDNATSKNNMTAVKKEDCFIVEKESSSGSNKNQEKNQTKVPRNWLIEEVPNIPNRVKEEASGKFVDVSGLELLSRGIEKIERESSGIKENLCGLELLCKLAEQRMKEDFITRKDIISHCKMHDKNDQTERSLNENNNGAEKIKQVSGKPKKTNRRREIITDSKKTQEMLPPSHEKVAHVISRERSYFNYESEIGALKSPELSPLSKTNDCALNLSEIGLKEISSITQESNREGMDNADQKIKGDDLENLTYSCYEERDEILERTTPNKSLKGNQENNKIELISEERKKAAPVKATQSKLGKASKAMGVLAGDTVVASVSTYGKGTVEPKCSLNWQKSVKSDGDKKSERNVKDIECDFDAEKTGRFTIVNSEDSHCTGGLSQSCNERLSREENQSKSAFLETCVTVKSNQNEKDKCDKRSKLIIKLRRDKNYPFEYNLVKKKEKLKTSGTNFLMPCITPIRILTIENGLFYTGQLCAVQFPDVFGITIDGERGNRPHIFSREDVLKNSILEVKPETVAELKPGVRVCAYWSNQYRSLYPGVISSSLYNSEEPQENSVVVAFDDGDCCQIDIRNIRYLPQLYPITECNRNPLQNFTRKRRRGKIENDSSCNSTLKIAIGAMEISAGRKFKSLSHIISDERLLPKRDLRLSKGRKHEKVLKLKVTDGLQKHGKKHKKHKHRHDNRHRPEKRKANNVDAAENDMKIIQENLNVSSDNHGVTDGCHSVRIMNKKRKTTKAEPVNQYFQSLMSSQKRILWKWSGKGFRRAGVKGKAKKEYYRSIQRGHDKISIGECAVFLSTGRPDRPFIGRIESMWQTWGANKVVRVKWFYHPEETVGCPASLEYPGALFESPHADENDIQTISHKCEVLPLKRYIERLGKGTGYFEGNTKLFYLAGYYDPTNTSLTFQEGVKGK